MEAHVNRIQLLLDPVDRKALKELANESHTSMSDVVRELLRERIKERKREKMQRAASLMAEEYLNNPELTSLTTAYFDEDTTDEAR
jgi:Arc/MetJ-type ribon-helix-helix transcriptional regulator